MILKQFDQSLSDGLTKILNIDLVDNKWQDNNLPIRFGGLEIRSQKMLAHFDFLASAASVCTLKSSIFPHPFWLHE